MRVIHHSMPGKFNWRCLFGHTWGEWSRLIYRRRLMGSDFQWEQRKCSRCGAGEGKEYPDADL